MHEPFDHGHAHSSFPGMMGGGTATSAMPGGADGTKGPFVYFVPKEAICGPKHAGPIPTLHLIQNPTTPGRIVGVSSPLPSYLTGSSMAATSILLPLFYSCRGGTLRVTEFI